MKIALTPTMVFLTTMLSAQMDSAKMDIPQLKFSGFAEIYYSFDASQPEDHERPAFLYNHNRHNEFNLNLGFVKAEYRTHNVRANVALGAGTYMNANYAAEPGVLKNIYEAHAGVKLSKNKNLWMDAGIFSSHLGFESAVSTDSWTLTRSINAESSPYYESGLKVSYTSPNDKWLFSLLLLNGWQRIQRPDGNNTPAGGHQLQFKPSDRLTLNSSSFIGNEFTDNVGRVRYFHNFYAILQLHKSIGITAGFDYGAQQSERGSNDYHTWYSPVVILKVTPFEKLSLVARAEHFNDEHSVIIQTGTTNGFQTYGYSATFDYEISENANWRLEGRVFESKDQIFTLDGQPDRQNYFVTSSIAVLF